MNAPATPPSTANWRGRTIPLGLFLLLPFTLVACEVIEVEQPSDVTQGEVIEVVVSLGLYSSDENPHRGVLSVLVPDDWSFISGTYSGDLGSGTIVESEAWADSTAIVLPPPSNMKWIGTTSANALPVPEAPAYVDATLRLEVGERLGTFGLGYFFTSTAFDTDDMDFTESGDYDDNTADSLMNQPITVHLATSNEGDARPSAFSLSPNYPNPFGASTQVTYALARPASVRVTVFDVAGREIAVLDEGPRPSGSHTVQFQGDDLPNGMYLYRLVVDGEVIQTRLMTRLR